MPETEIDETIAKLEKLTVNSPSRIRLEWAIIEVKTAIGTNFKELSIIRGIFTFPDNPNGMYLGKKVKKNIPIINNQSFIFCTYIIILYS